METIAVAAIGAVLVLALTVIRTQARMMETVSTPQVDVSQVVRDVLDRFVEQSKSTNETITGVYAPPAYVAPMPAPLPDSWGPEDGARMTTVLDFDDSDPTDEYLRPVRESVTLLSADGDDNPFGIPGLVYSTRKDQPLTVAEILGTGRAAR
jgi:hypothetical protein